VSQRKIYLSREELRALPTAVGLETAANALGISRTKAYRLAKYDEFPVPVLRLGNSYRVPTAPLLKFLGVDEPDHSGDTLRPATAVETATSPRIRRKIDPDKRYRIRDTGEVVTGAELLKKRGQAQ
jgi:hypothetical protein